MAKKTGSKRKVECPICHKVMTSAGLIGHMAWKHGKDYKAPMFPSKALPVAEAREMAMAFHSALSKREKWMAYLGGRGPRPVPYTGSELEALLEDLFSKWERRKR
jgi:hypothetical protein